MRESIVRSYEELPLFLSAQNVADVLGGVHLVCLRADA